MRSQILGIKPEDIQGVKLEDREVLIGIADIAEDLQIAFEAESGKNSRVLVAAGHIGDLELVRRLVRQSDDYALRAEIAKKLKLAALGREREMRWGGV